MFKTCIPALFKRDKGFTLIELLVVMLIISIMTAIILINYRTGGQQLALNRSASKLAQDIRRTQEMAMSATICEVCGNIVPPRYGIYIAQPDINPTSIILFADEDDSGTYTPPGDTIITNIPFESDVHLYSISSSTCSSGFPPMSGHHRSHLSFRPPDPTTELLIGHPIAGIIRSCDEIVLTLRVDASGPTKSVKINNAGLIYVE